MNLYNKSILLIVLFIAVALHKTKGKSASSNTNTKSDNERGIANVVGDVVIVGGGTGGLTIAYELATKTNLNVHVLEAGGDPTSFDPDIDVPLKLFNVSQNPNNEWGFVSTPQVHAGDAILSLSRFKGLGGCSQHNGEGFWLASEFNYDKWPKGFKYKDFNKAAREFEGCVSFGPPNHGTTGPLYTKLDDLDQIDPYLKAWKRAALQAEYRFNPDENAPLVKGYMPHVISIKDGARFGPYHVFKSVMGRLPNLHVHLNTTVTKILFKGRDSKGKLQIKGVKADNVDFNGVQRKMRYLATKAVVLAAGALQTPQILMVSGIGDRNVLDKAGIDVKLHLPGVGKNLKDHIASLFVINSKKIPPLNDPVFFENQAALYAATRQGYFGYSVADHSVVRTSSNGDKHNASVPGDIVLSTTAYTFIPGFEPNQILSVVVLTDPKSSGTVTVSSDSVYDPPVVDLNYFSNSEDFEVLYKGFDLMREIFTKPALSSWFDFEIFPYDADNLTIKSQILTTDHLMGTCMIGDKNEEFAVVDNNGAVFGTSGLFVADASAIRTVDGATPNSSIHGTVILLAQIVAEKLKSVFC